MFNQKILRIILIAAAAFMLFSCAPRKVLKTTEAVAEGKKVEVTEKEISYWKDLARTGKDSIERSKGAFWSGQYYLNRGDYKAAVEYFSHNRKYYADVKWGYLSVMRLAEIYTERRETEKAAGAIRLLAEKRRQFPSFKNVAAQKLEKLASVMTVKGLNALYESHTHPLIDEYVLYHLCGTAFKKNEYDAFFKYARIFLADFSESPFYAEILKKFKEAIKYKPVNNRKLGVIIPLSGKAMDIGKIVRAGLELGLGEYNREKEEGEKVSLVYIDESLPGLEDNVIKAIEEESVIAFIGPLYSRTVKELLPLIERYNVALFSPTASQPGLTAESRYFFRNCGTARGQAYAMARYAAKETEHEKLATIYPENPYGRALSGFFTEKFNSIKPQGVTRQVSYSPKKSDFKKQMVLLGGIDAILLKEKRAGEKRALAEEMEAAGERIRDRVVDYMTLYKGRELDEEDLPKIEITLLHLAPMGENITRFDIDREMTYKLSYAAAKSKRVRVNKQARSNRAMRDIGVGPADLDRELALNVAYRLDSDVLIWGRIEEEEPETEEGSFAPADSGVNTMYSNFLPEAYIDDNGNTKIAYNFKHRDYYHYDVTIYVLSVTDEQLIDEIHIDYRRLKKPRLNPLEIDALYIPSGERKIVLIKDQLKFYDFDLPVFGSSSLAGSYLKNFRQSVEGIIFPVEYYDGDNSSEVREFVTKYRDRYASSTNVISANSYDLIKIMCALIERNINSRESFKNVLKSVRNYVGVTGKFSFNEYGDSVKDYYIMKMGLSGPVYLRKMRGE